MDGAKMRSTVFVYQPGGRTGKQRFEKAAAAGGQNGGALPEAVQGAADGKQQAEKPAAQKRRYTIGRHAEPDDSNADAGGKNVVAEKEKLLSQAIQKSVKGGLRIEQGTEEGKRKQHLPQCRAVIDDIADFVWKNGKQRRRPEPDDRGKKEGGGNGFADAGILLDGAGSEISGTRETDAAIRQAEVQAVCCKRAFMRGAFLAAGSMSDPGKSYHFEIVCDQMEKHSTCSAL